MELKKKKIMKALFTIVIFIILLIIWLLLGGKSFAKYQKEVNANGSLEIAKPIFVVDGANEINIKQIEDTVYSFTVKNYNDTSISEVEMNYLIQITNNSQTDLEFVLTKNGKNIHLQDNKTDFISLAKSRKQEDCYELKINYRNAPASTEDIDGTVQIKVEAVQAEKR